ncbi:gluconate 2-dehydrogenase subunit 3 family protein [Roseomonas sp. M0104]|uniref:Gluconate 2-dehydrogenase subunit 3 family protein n=1 Tax=Teichococcus coralli TaxID=2545983 RepID=A0A845BHZ4_9PROT|nr:gluconate 2-dehydrogenase subunit 3 family protein [Pseudoroseomonas coralli]MXP63059.1 gluconate 2-dehydrogenase subunit 3 family protein [Pseudoroseomonas coralli]
MPDPGRYPGYDVLRKRHTPSWNDKTRQVVDARLAVPREPRFFTGQEMAMVTAIADRLVPQPRSRPPVPVAALIDDKLHKGHEDGFRGDGMPREREAWRRGLAALDAEARARHGAGFAGLPGPQQDALLKRMEQGGLSGPAWGGMPSKTFFKQRMAKDIVFAYYAHPTAWSEIGFGGPASPRGYVRLGYDERDPWEAAEARDGDAGDAQRKNRNVG